MRVPARRPHACRGGLRGRHRRRRAGGRAARARSRGGRRGPRGRGAHRRAGGRGGHRRRGPELHGRRDARRRLAVDRRGRRARGVPARATSPSSRTRARSPRPAWRPARASASAPSSLPAASCRAISPTSSPTWPATRARRRSGCSPRRSAAPSAFAAALALAAEAGKPVVCLKVGRSQAAARAALAHSGAVVGSARAFSALLRHHGAIEVGDFHELLRDARAAGPPPLAARAAHRGRLGVGRRMRAAGRPRRGRPESRSRRSTRRSRPG